MSLSSENKNDLSLEFLNSYYINTVNLKGTDKFTVPDSVIDTLISLDEQLQSFPDYDEKKNIIRQFVAEKLFTEIENYAPDRNSASYLIFSQKIEAFFFCYKLFLNICETDFTDKELYEKIEKCKQQARARQDFSYLPEIIVSMTSFPARIDKVYKSLNSIFTQSFKPDRTILWLAEEQFPDGQLPKSLTDYIQLGLEIRWCKEDLRSHKKYFYVMQEYPKALIITVDDDLIYDSQMIEALVTSYLHFPSAVSAVRTHLMKLDGNGKIAPYSQWGKEFSGILGQPSMQLFSTSGAGTLYPPNCMDEELFNLENIKRLSFNADDLWFKVMQLKKGTPVVLARPNENLVYVHETQGVGLYHLNEKLNENDIQLNNILNVYDSENVLLSQIFKDGYTIDSKVVGIDIYENNDFGTLYSVPTHLSDSLKLENEFRKLEKKYNLLEENYKKRSEDYFNQKSKLSDAERKLKIADSRLKKAEGKNNALSKEIADIKSSVFFRIGRIITFIPCKIRGGIKCYRENGFKYTVNRLLEKIKKQK